MRFVSLSDRERVIRQRLKDDFPHFAAKCLKIRTKSGSVEPLVLNQAQGYIHQKLEEQRAKLGRVRALLLKARQQGASTYIGGRFYWKAAWRNGIQVFILTHEQDATDNLFGMVDRYHTHCPALVKPSTGASNAKELYFDQLDSGYSVGTAGSKAVGRSKTVQLFHGSEAAFWPNAPTHFAGVIQAIPELPDTEIILESTAQFGSEFHARWQQAEAGIGDYITIFVPWFWSDEYRRAAPDDFTMDDEEWEYADAHGLDLDQMCWRRAKIAELKDPLLFKQEYPATAAEAFQVMGHDSFIKPETVLKARKAVCKGIGPLVIGVDPKREGNDRFSIAWRQGRHVSKVQSDPAQIDTLRAATMLKEIIDADKPAKMFIDAGGGTGIFDVLVSWGYGKVMVLVNFGSRPIGSPRMDSDGKPMAGPANRRSEMWMLSRDWLEDEGGADIPDSDAIQSDACAPGYHYDTNQRLLLTSKEQMRAKGLRSTDEWDAIALTFAEPVLDRPSVSRITIPAFGAV
jgi:hypothetical protein